MRIIISVKNDSLPEFNTASFAVIDTNTQEINIKTCPNYAAIEAVKKVIKNNGGRATFGMWVAEEAN